MNCSKSTCWRERYFLKIVGLSLLLACSLTAFPQKAAKTVATLARHPKLAPSLLTVPALGKWREVRVRVEDVALFRTWVSQQMPAVQLGNVLWDNKTLLVSKLSETHLARLIECPWVTFVDVPNRIPQEETKRTEADKDFNTITPVHSRFPLITGEGLVVSIKEKAFDKTNIDFKGRIVNPEQMDTLFTAHATRMATLVAGAGNTEPDKKGVAWKARLASAAFDNLFPDNTTELKQMGVSVQNHSYGVDIENYYGLEAQAYDQQSMQYPELLHVFSSGNLGDQASTVGAYAAVANVANLSGQFKMSKNTLSVGATDESGKVADQSSRGPAYDGRVKPEVVAYGGDGTSESAALVSGIALLVQHAFQMQSAGKLPPASLVKAVIINSAQDVGRPEVDFESGFGRVDAWKAVETIAEKRFFIDSLASTEEKIVTVQVPENTVRFKITLVWHDPAAAPNAAHALLNDLDMELVHPVSGEHWKPWVLNAYPHPDSLLLPARRGVDHLNNVEQVTVNLPQSGRYELHVRSDQVLQGTQAFSVAFEAEEGFDWTYPTREDHLLPQEPTQLRWNWAGPSKTAQLAYKEARSTKWQVIENAVDLSQLTYAWTPPDTTAFAQFRLVTDEWAVLSDTFAIAKPISLEVGLSCPEEALLYWAAVPGVDEYQLFALGASYAMPVLRTADTSVVLTDTSVQNYAVAPVLSGKVAVRSSMVDYTRQGSGCYIQSFLPRQLVADSVVLDVVLGSVYRLRALYLEKWDGSRFQKITTVMPVEETNLSFVDPNPGSGKNVYRIVAENDQGGTFTSQLESIFFVGSEDLLLFPNPVIPGQVLTIIESDPLIRVRLYTSMGQVVSDSTESGVVKNIATDHLTRGLYFIRVEKQDGKELIGRLIVQ